MLAVKARQRHLSTKTLVRPFLILTSAVLEISATWEWDLWAPVSMMVMVFSIRRKIIVKSFYKDMCGFFYVTIDFFYLFGDYLT